jgi:hypothetical protein
MLYPICSPLELGVPAGVLLPGKSCPDEPATASASWTSSMWACRSSSRAFRALPNTWGAKSKGVSSQYSTSCPFCGNHQKNHPSVPVRRKLAPRPGTGAMWCASDAAASETLPPRRPCCCATSGVQARRAAGAMLEDPLQRHQGVAQVCTPAFMASTRVWLDSNAASTEAV